MNIDFLNWGSQTFLKHLRANMRSQILMFSFSQEKAMEPDNRMASSIYYFRRILELLTSIIITYIGVKYKTPF